MHCNHNALQKCEKPRRDWQPATYPFSINHVTKMFHHFGHMTLCFCHLEFLNTSRMNAYSRTYSRAGKSLSLLDKYLRSRIVDIILSEGGDVIYKRILFC